MLLKLADTLLILINTGPSNVNRIICYFFDEMLNKRNIIKIINLLCKFGWILFLVDILIFIQTFSIVYLNYLPKFIMKKVQFSLNSWIRLIILASSNFHLYPTWTVQLVRTRGTEEWWESWLIAVFLIENINTKMSPSRAGSNHSLSWQIFSSIRLWLAWLVTIFHLSRNRNWPNRAESLIFLS